MNFQIPQVLVIVLGPSQIRGNGYKYFRLNININHWNICANKKKYCSQFIWHKLSVPKHLIIEISNILAKSSLSCLCEVSRIQIGINSLLDCNFILTFFSSCIIIQYNMQWLSFSKLCLIEHTHHILSEDSLRSVFNLQFK